MADTHLSFRNSRTPTLAGPEPQDSKPWVPSVSGLQWGLAGFILVLSLLGFVIGTHTQLQQLLVVIVVLHLALMFSVGVETLRTRVCGKLLLTGCTLVFFWLEALQVASRTPPFFIPENFTIPGYQYDLSKLSLAIFYIALFQLLVFVGYSFRPRLTGLISAATSRFDSNTNRSRILKYVIATCFWVPVAISLGFHREVVFDALLSSRSSTRGEAADIGGLRYIWFLGGFGAALLLVEATVFANARRWPLMLLLAVAALAPAVMLNGSRNVWIAIALPTMVIGLAWSARRWSIGKMARWGMILLAFFVVMNLQFNLRDKGWSQITKVDPKELLSGGSDNGQFEALVFALYYVPDQHAYFYEPAEPFFLIYWIPRTIWPSKPLMQSWISYDSAYPKIGAFNVTPSILGQFHINWGLPGILYIGLLLGFLTVTADRVLSALDLDRQRAIAVAVGLFYAFIVNSFRFYNPIYFTFFGFAVVCVYFLSRNRRLSPSVQPGRSTGRRLLAPDAPRG